MVELDLHTEGNVVPWENAETILNVIPTPTCWLNLTDKKSISSDYKVDSSFLWGWIHIFFRAQLMNSSPNSWRRPSDVTPTWWSRTPCPGCHCATEKRMTFVSFLIPGAASGRAEACSKSYHFTPTWSFYFFFRALAVCKLLLHWRPTEQRAVPQD